MKGGTACVCQVLLIHYDTTCSIFGHWLISFYACIPLINPFRYEQCIDIWGGAALSMRQAFEEEQNEHYELPKESEVPADQPQRKGTCCDQTRSEPRPEEQEAALPVLTR